MAFKSIKEFFDRHYHHFNAAVVKEAAQAWVEQLRQGNKMVLAMAGAMSTAELGISLAEMIRQKKIHAISTTGANLEEDLFNLVAHNNYKRVPHYRQLSPIEEMELRDQKLNRVTDTCIPEQEAMMRIEKKLLEQWQKLDKSGERLFPYESFYKLIQNEQFKENFQIDPKNSWVLAACENNLPIYTPGWEDSTIGNFAVSQVIRGKIKSNHFIKSGLEQMQHLVSWYRQNTKENGIGFFQIGGGIAGDFPICVVPLMIEDLKENAKFWSYFCQISDSTTSYGSYSGAVPNEKITWHKLDVDTPKFIIESDATIVAPLVFEYVLEQKI